MIKKTFEYLYDKSKKYDNILVTDEPTNGPHGVRIRELFKKQKNSDDLKEEIFKEFINDRNWHINEVIFPLLKKDFLIIGDRYKYSSIVYQTVQGNDFDIVFDSHKNFLSPDIIFILDLPAKVGFERIKSDRSTKRRESDNFRELQFIQKLRDLYLKMPGLFPSEKIVIIDASLSKNQVFQQIKVHLEKIL